MNIEIQNFKSPKMGLAFIYIYMKILEYPSPPLGTHCALSFKCFFKILLTCDHDLFVTRAKCLTVNHASF